MLECIGCNHFCEQQSLEPPEDCLSSTCEIRTFFKKINKQMLQLYFKFWFLKIEPFVEIRHIGEDEFRPSLVLFHGERELELISKIDEMNDGSISVLNFEEQNHQTRIYGKLAETGNPFNQLAAQHEFNLFLSQVLNVVESETEMKEDAAEQSG